MSEGAGSAVFYTQTEDPEMEQAMALARANFKYLWRELTWEYRRIVPALELSAIKAAFQDPGGELDAVEHMWLSEIEFDGDKLRATLLNSPNQLTSIQEGDQLTLRLDQVEDWMFAMQGHVYGGYTIQVLRRRMSAAERRAHDDAWGFSFAEPSRVALVPWGDPDAEHPMSENMGDSLAEAIAKDRSGFLQLGSAGLSTLHSLALGGSAAGVRVLLQAGADPHQATKHGKTALELAEMMGWPRVAELLREAAAKN